MVNPKSIAAFFLGEYAGKSVELREKSRLFFYLLVFTGFILVVILVIINIFLDLRATNYVVISIILAIAVCLGMLRYGMYHVAVNFFSLVIAAGIVFLGFYGQISRGREDYITNYYYFPLVVIFTALFCSERWMVVTTSLLIASGIASYAYYLQRPLGPEFNEVAKGALIDYTTASVFSFMLCYIIIRINRRITSSSLQEERGRELQTQLDVARLIQSKLLPDTTLEDPRFSISSVYIPMDKIGGDFFDVFKRDNELHVFIADVSGHGIPGAQLALIAKVALMHVAPGASNTAEAINQINRMICDCSVLGNFVSCFYCIIDHEMKRIRFTSAGHLPPLLYRPADHTLREIHAKGMVLGWKRDLVLREYELGIDRGDRLVFYTDGVTECMDEGGGIFGEDRLRDSIRRCADLPVSTFTKIIVDRLAAFRRGINFRDDLTLLVIDIN